MQKCVKNPISSLLVILIATISVLFEMSAFGAMRDCQIEISNNEWAADIENATLDEVLEKIHKRAGIEFSLVKGHFDRAITVKFTSLPIERALARILSKLSYAVLYGADNRILRVMIIGTNKTTPTRYTDPVIDDQFLEREISTDTLPEVGTKSQVSAWNHGMIVESTSMASEMAIESPSVEEMEIAPPPSDTDMIIDEPPNGKEMEIAPPPSDADMIINEPSSGEEMGIIHSSTAMVIEPQSKGG